MFLTNNCFSAIGQRCGAYSLTWAVGASRAKQAFYPTQSPYLRAI